MAEGATVALTDEQKAMAESRMNVAIGYVKSRRYSKRYQEDYLQVAFLAVVRAARSYKLDAPYDFETYAWMRIRRAVADYIASNRPIRIPIDGHVSRYKSRSRAIERAKAAASAARFVGLDDLPGGGDLQELGRSREPWPDAMAEASEFSEAVWMAVSTLPEAERGVIEAVCLGGREMADLAREQGKWPSVIRHQRERGLSRLRRRLQAFGPKEDDD